VNLSLTETYLSLKFHYSVVMGNSKSQSAKRKRGKSKEPVQVPPARACAPRASIRKRTSMALDAEDHDDLTPPSNNEDLPLMTSGRHGGNTRYKTVMSTLPEEDEFDSVSSFAPEPATPSDDGLDTAMVSDGVDEIPVKRPAKGKAKKGRPKKTKEDHERSLPNKDRSVFSCLKFDHQLTKLFPRACFVHPKRQF
jgi:hypothetical protein